MKIVKELCINEIVIEKSRFITYLKRINSHEDAQEFINEIKKKYWDANHRCLAYTLDNQKYMKSSDDGEPSGTAGVPILEVLKKNEITDTICIVIRYFGGIKLGAGGLIRAYSKSVSEALNNAKFIQKTILKSFSIEYDYSYISSIEKLLRGDSYNIFSTYEVNVKTNFLTNNLSLLTKLKDITNGKITIIQNSDEYLDLDI